MVRTVQTMVRGSAFCFCPGRMWCQLLFAPENFGENCPNNGQRVLLPFFWVGPRKNVARTVQTMVRESAFWGSWPNKCQLFGCFWDPIFLGEDCDTLFHLNLSFNSFSATDCAVFAEALASNRSLFGLHLTGVRIGAGERLCAGRRVRGVGGAEGGGRGEFFVFFVLFLGGVGAFSEGLEPEGEFWFISLNRKSFRCSGHRRKSNGERGKSLVFGGFGAS